MNGLAGARPTLLDRVDLLLLRLAKRNRGRYLRSIDFYETFFAEHDLKKYVLDVRNAWRFGVIRRVLDRELPEGARVVDVGCGLGSARLFLSERHEYVGVDVSVATLAHARRIHPGPGTQFRAGGFPDLPLGSGEAGAVLCLEVLEHISDDESAVAELARVLRPGGLLVVSVPNSFYWTEYMPLIGHVRHYDACSLTKLLERHGFAVARRIPQGHGFWRAYHYLYLVLRGMEAAARRMSRSSFSVYETRSYQRLSKAVLVALERRETGDDPTSTFVVCRLTEDDL